MNLKRILKVANKDFKSGIREFVLLYLMIAPILLAVGLSFFIPTASNITLKFALHESVEPGLQQEFESYGDVQIFESQEQLQGRLSQVDEVIGISKEDGKYQVLLYGDEREGIESIAYKILANYEGTYEGIDNDIEMTSSGYKSSPTALLGITSLIIMSLILGGAMIGLSIIEEKENKTLSALNTTPLRNTEFIIGKSLFGALIAFVQIFLIVIITGYSDINFLKAFILTMTSLTILIMFGFIIGVLSSNQISGLANMKFLFIPAAASIIGGFLLPTSKQFLLYWSPIYWSYNGYRDLITYQLSWENLGLYCGSILLIAVIIYMMSYKKISRSLF